MLQSEALAAFAQQKGLQNPFRIRKVMTMTQQSCLLAVLVTVPNDVAFPSAQPVVAA